ncbi:hypothetical protein PSN45_005040 [Yamadazyma tenuis]|uniref:Charged multivesicular body protein 7 n=1 Tax=Candida tenuis (strain ATCC 10573 / BCRC 21748 / CBS 615 / JCM 9827 / NBRC 10315 / NRRL Y-1498 / VKM Y-70) TaxID=590646 RepID=G3B2K6_CANTC|nr:uncharacterized protein CANTEDRAFT_120565 [Yamadazyma tenuis ATCC 10573]EGV64699.1 hypothetical protein CANTEDRAFT_120565 [Yamadazyma tenuis ATCC 10573]WEJ97487.1 hypothetical protein PSN45_005040 [Yamadazyma tenuis]
MPKPLANQNYQLLKDKTSYSVSRIGALYKDFKDAKELNPEGFEANLISWLNIFKVALENDVIEASKLAIPHKKPDLSSMLVLPTIGKPLSLDVIIGELTESKSLIPVSLFLAYESNIHNYLNTTTSIFTYLYPSHWADRVSGIGRSLSNIFSANSERYVHWPFLVEFGKIFMNTINKEVKGGVYSSKIFDEGMLIDIIHKNITKNFSMLDLQILVKYLSRDTNECTTKMSKEDILVVKFDDQSPVTDEDISIAKLRFNMSQVAKRMSSIEMKIGEINHKVKEYPSDKIKNDEAIKTKVMMLLGERRSQIKAFQSCSSAYQHLQEIVLKIDDATSNISLVNALKQSSKALNQLNDQVDLEEIDLLHVEIGDQIEATDQVTDALVTVQISDEEIEDEYNALLNEQKNDEQESNELLNKLQGLHVGSEIKINEKEAKEAKDAPAKQKAQLIRN